MADSKDHLLLTELGREKHLQSHENSALTVAFEVP